MKKHLLILCLLVAPRAFALKEYFSISKSLRALGMGNAFYGLSNDEYALFYNPAGLSFYPHGSQGMFNFQGQVTSGFTDVIKTVTDSKGKGIDQVVLSLEQFQGKPLFLGASFMPYYLRKHFAIALLAPDVKSDVAVLGKDFDTQVDVAAIGDAGLLIGYGNSFFDPNLYLGITFKGLYRVGGSKTYTTLDIVNQTQASPDLKSLGGGGAGFDFDLGATYELPFKPFNSTIRTSLVLNNLLASQFSIARLQGSAAPPALPRTVTIAGNWRLPGWNVFDHFDVVVDFSEFQVGGESDPTKGSRTGNFFKHLNWGVEAPFLSQFFALRTGFRQGYFSFGFGITTRFLKLDLATYQEELLTNPGQLGSRRFAARLAFGFGAAAPAVEPQTEGHQPPPEQTKEKPPDVITQPPPPAAEVPKEPVKPPEEPKKADPKKQEQRKPQSETKLKPDDGGDRFNVDNLVEEYPKSYNYPE